MRKTKSPSKKSSVRSRGGKSNADDLECINVMIFTWNVGGSEFVLDQLQQFFSNNQMEDLDVFVMGLQESAMVNWHETVTKCLDGRLDFMCSEELGGVRLAVWTSKAVVVSQFRSVREGTGIGNVLTNKGGVCVQLDVTRVDVNHHFSLGFICAHLAAHMGKVEERNADVYQLFGRLAFDGRTLEEWLSRFDAAFFFGDLNYRIENNSQEILDSVAKGDWEALSSRDQLVKQLRNRYVLSGFKEGSICFPPTFKVAPNQQHIVYSKKREPAWCDRILFRSRDHLLIFQQEYSSVTELISSDHRPVKAFFKLALSPELSKGGSEPYCWEVSFSKVEVHILDSSFKEFASEVYMVIINNHSSPREATSSHIGTSNDQAKFSFLALPKITLYCTMREFRSANVLFILKDHKMVESDDLIGLGYLDFFKVASDEGKLELDGQVTDRFAIRASKLSKRIAIISGTVIVTRRSLSSPAATATHNLDELPEFKDNSRE
eukprot:TRINITY_DN5621_c0_g1_i1.p1 TRINITY_DN5621_c0_g1~~TRINITY_DN5621_c0_g1_i1.p1  ORF type:complete len:540 (-),score=135.28 TRINITY_DN5621_c0_g1_i1:1698-3170(-)